jgi:hypothetical protein
METTTITTASHYLIVTDAGERVCYTIGDLQDDAMACEYRGLMHSTYVVFDDGSSLPINVG